MTAAEPAGGRHNYDDIVRTVKSGTYPGLPRRLHSSAPGDDKRVPDQRIAVVVPTIGRPALLDRLMESISMQTLAAAEVIVIDQSEDDRTRAVVESWRPRIPVRRLTSVRGISVGLNTGIAALGDHDVVGIACDDTYYAPDAFAHAAKALTADTALGAVSGRLLGVAGRPAQLQSFADRPMLLDDRSVWTSAIEATCFYRAGFLRDVGVFDEELGAGAASPWQSGEGTDLLLRGLKAGWPIAYDPRIVIFEDNPDDPARSTRAARIKARRSARGTGRVFRRHHGLGRQLRVVIRPLGGAVLSACRGRWAYADWHLQRFLGRVEGLTGRVLPGARP